MKSLKNFSAVFAVLFIFALAACQTDEEDVTIVSDNTQTEVEYEYLYGINPSDSDGSYSYGTYTATTYTGSLNPYTAGYSSYSQKYYSGYTEKTYRITSATLKKTVYKNKNYTKYEIQFHGYLYSTTTRNGSMDYAETEYEKGTNYVGSLKTLTYYKIGGKFYSDIYSTSALSFSSGTPDSNTFSIYSNSSYSSDYKYEETTLSSSTFYKMEGARYELDALKLKKR